MGYPCLCQTRLLRFHCCISGLQYRKGVKSSFSKYVLQRR